MASILVWSEALRRRAKRNAVEPLDRIAEISAVAAAAGINPWLAALTLVGLSALGMIDTGGLPLIDSELGDPVVLVALVAGFLIEQVADKIPGVDHVSDLVHLPIKPVAAIGLAVVVAAPEDPSNLGDYMVPLAIAAGIVALLAHLGKAGIRGGSTTTTAGLGNPVLSVLEDMSVVGLIVLAVLVPVLALIAVGAAVVFGVRAIVRLTRARTPRPGAEP